MSYPCSACPTWHLKVCVCPGDSSSSNLIHYQHQMCPFCLFLHPDQTILSKSSGHISDTGSRVHTNRDLASIRHFKVKSTVSSWLGLKAQKVTTRKRHNRVNLPYLPRVGSAVLRPPAVRGFLGSVLNKCSNYLSGLTLREQRLYIEALWNHWTLHPITQRDKDQQ